MKRRFSGFFLGAAFVWLFLFTMSPLPQYLTKKLEDRYPLFTPSAVNKGMNILVLGGGYTNDATLPAKECLSNYSLARLSEGIRLKMILPDSRMVFSGAPKEGTTKGMAMMCAEAALSLGISPKDTLMLTGARNTVAEAEAYKSRFGAERRFILVTSAFHMPRAMMAFQRAGLHPIAAPTNYLIRRDGESVYHFFPTGTKAIFTEKALHEYLGMFYLSNFGI